MSEPVVNIFVSYSHQDPGYLNDDSLLGFLKGLEKRGNVKFWTDRHIIGSNDWDKVIKDNLQEAQVALVLVSQHFLDSDYCQNVEIERLLRQTSYLLPVILSPCDWQEHEWLASRQFLPGGEETIEEHYTDDGTRKRLFLDIRKQLKVLIEQAHTGRHREATHFTADVKSTFCQELGEGWKLLVVYFQIPRSTRERFAAGQEADGLWDWLDESNRLADLEEALAFIDRQELWDKMNAPSEPAPVGQTASEPVWEGSPFRGLETFTERHAEIFFGRNAEISELMARLADSRFLAVVGASGSGKSSLVAAGLLPRLADLPGGADWLVVRFTPGGLGDDPFQALAARLERHLEEKLTGRQIADMLRTSGDLAELVELILEDRPRETKLLLFIDQFEELFTLTDPVYHQPFIAMLSKAEQAEQAEEMRIVLTLRADFYHRCVEDARLARLLRTGSFPLAAPGTGALLEMITRPADRAGLTFEAGLPGRILEDTGREPGALALMEFALAELYEHRESNGNLTHAAYDNLKGVQGVINKHADETYAQLNDAEESALGRVFKELVEVDPERGVPTRKRAAMSHFSDVPAALALIEKFTEARLLVRNRADNQEDVVEVAHEAVLTHWEVLKNWIEARFDDFRLLRQVKLAAAEWERYAHADHYLWPHERLEPVAKMLENLHPVALNPAEQEFVRPESERLLKKIDDRNISHQERVKIGDRLAEIGDPRPDVGLNEAGLPDIDWCEVPGGEVTLEHDAGTFDVAPGYISKYPVTWVQYRCFLQADDGYAKADWWEGLAQRDEEDEEPGEQNRKLDNHPAEYVSWYDAMSYCRWLSEKLGYEIRLPTEWEWQQAATGGNAAYKYPWGSDWHGDLANTSESGQSRTTAVGMYPDGVSPVGALDMSGNVWEWCLNLYNDPNDNDLSSSSSRVVRGGSWNLNPNDARARVFATTTPRRSATTTSVFVCGVRPPSAPETLSSVRRVSGM